MIAVGPSERARQLLAGADFLDLHNDLLVPARLFGYDAWRDHRRWLGQAPFFGHTDFPRLHAAGLTGVVMDLATQPFRAAAGRRRALLANVQDWGARLQGPSVAWVEDAAGYRRARQENKLALFWALQGGNALGGDLDLLAGPLGRRLHRITLVHLTDSPVGCTSSPQGRGQGLTAHGRALVEACNAARILVCLAHASKASFWDALAVQAADQPPIVSHTGLSGVREHWRNLDDRQVRAIADRGGVIGVMVQSNFLAPVRWRARRSDFVDHLDHLRRVGGREVVALGTDFDGMVVPPLDLADATWLPCLVDDLLARGWVEDDIRGFLGANYLRVVERVRPADGKGPTA